MFSQLPANDWAPLLPLQTNSDSDMMWSWAESTPQLQILSNNHLLPEDRTTCFGRWILVLFSCLSCICFCYHMLCRCKPTRLFFHKHQLSSSTLTSTSRQATHLHLHLKTRITRQIGTFAQFQAQLQTSRGPVLSRTTNQRGYHYHYHSRTFSLSTAMAPSDLLDREILPDTVQPLNYELSIHDIELGGAFSYQGRVSILAKIATPTKEITLNSHQ